MIHLLLVFCIFIGNVNAQTTKVPAVKAPTRTVTTEHSVEVTTQKESSPKIAESLCHLEKELEEITALTQDPKLTPCQLKELELRKQDAQFLKDHADQIQDIVSTVRKGLRAQLSVLKDYKNGVVTGFEKEASEASPSIIFKVQDEDGTIRNKTIYVNDLIQYVMKYQTEANETQDDEASVKELVAKYSHQETETKDEFFHMTLDQAKKAYFDFLGTSFMISNKEVQKRALVVGEGKTTFRIATTTTLGYQPRYNNKIGTSLRSDLKDQSGVSLNIIQNFDEAFKIAEEDDVWKVIREMQLNIEVTGGAHGQTRAIPIDGYLRRTYFESLKGQPACTNLDTVYVYRKNTPAGPYISANERDPCVGGKGIRVVAATLSESGARSDRVYNITKELASQSDGKNSVASDNGYRNLVQSLNLNNAEMLRLQIEYRCGCELVNRIKKVTYKIGLPVGFGCQ